jgi:hypothetical protein
MHRLAVHPAISVFIFSGNPLIHASGPLFIYANAIPEEWRQEGVTCNHL